MTSNWSINACGCQTITRTIEVIIQQEQQEQQEPELWNTKNTRRTTTIIHITPVRLQLPAASYAREAAVAIAAANLRLRL